MLVSLLMRREVNFRASWQKAARYEPFQSDCLSRNIHRVEIEVVSTSEVRSRDRVIVADKVGVKP